MTHDTSRISRRAMLASMAVLALPGSRAFAFATAAQREAVIVEKATEALVEITRIPARGLPLSLLRQAQGLVIVPDLLKAGFVITGRVGRGVLVARDEAGAWTNPVFLGMAGGGIGAQIGAQASDVILVFRTKRSVEDFLRHNKVTLGADAAVAAGPVGRQAEADTDLQMRAEILSYARSRGLFAGVSIEGSSLHVRHRANDAYYGVANLLVGDILVGRDADDNPLIVPPSAARLRATLNTMTLPAVTPVTHPVDPEVERSGAKRSRRVR
jgi:lipid-binding SYLF domain-containing protein